MGKMVAVVAGGAGFIGSHLCEALLRENFSVICLDNLSSGSKINTDSYSNNPCFTFLECDVSESIESKLIIDQDAEVFIFHLASPASVVDYQNLPEETALANSLGTYHLLQLCKKYNARFLMASTSEVYGDPLEHPQKETYWGNVNPIGPRACYDESKRFAEMITMLYHKKHKIDTRIVRIFNTYGPRMRKTDGRVISNFLTQSLEGKPITVYGKGNQTRSFCYVSDLVDGIMKAMMTPGISGEVINLGNPDEYNIIDIARKIQELTNSLSEIVFEQLPPDDPKERNPDIDKAIRLLGWKPQVKFLDGLKRTVAYYQEQ